MATTPEMVLELTIALTDNQDENGNYKITDNNEYRYRTLQILNTLIPELYPYSDTYKITEKGKRPIIPYLTDFEEDIDLDDYICRSVLPEGLAAWLLMTEDPSSASTHLQVYEERKANLARGMPAESEQIVDVYGGGYYDADGNYHDYFPYNDMAEWAEG